MRTYSLQEYFYYTRLERNAGIVLCLLCAIVYSLPLAYPLLLEPIGKIDFSQVQRIAAALAPASQPDEAGSASVAFRVTKPKLGDETLEGAAALVTTTGVWPSSGTTSGAV